jgi:hypothetical protein
VLGGGNEVKTGREKGQPAPPEPVPRPTRSSPRDSPPGTTGPWYSAAFYQPWRHGSEAEGLEALATRAQRRAPLFRNAALELLRSPTANAMRDATPGVHCWSRDHSRSRSGGESPVHGCSRGLHAGTACW